MFNSSVENWLPDHDNELQFEHQTAFPVWTLKVSTQQRKDLKFD